MLTLYRILSYVLLPVALLLGLATLAGLVMALANFSILLSVFATGATTIYIIASFLFLQRVVEGRQKVKHSLRDWVRVNAFVALFFSALLVAQSIMFMANPQLMNQAIEQMATMQQTPLPPETVIKSIKAALVIMLSLGVVILVHVLITLRLLKSHSPNFS